MYYPIYIELSGKRCTVIGGGAVAERKVETLLEFGAEVRLISPAVTPALSRLADAGRIEYFDRGYRSGDLPGSTLVYSATDDRETNQRVYEEALASGVPVNVVDVPDQCSFIVPSIVRRGDLMIAISTQGSSPAFAKRLRKRLEQDIGPEYEPYLHLLGEFRDRVKDTYTNPRERSQAYDRFLDSDILDLIRSGQADAARERMAACI